MSDETTHYDILDVAPSASKAEVKAAYQAALDAARASGDADHEAGVRRAWQVLSDPVQRQRYDEEIGLSRRAATASASTAADGAEDDDDGADHEHVGSDDVEVVDDLAPGPRRPGAHLPVGAPAFLEQPTLGRRLVASMVDSVTFLAIFVGAAAIVYQVTPSSGSRYAALVVLLEVLIIGLFVWPTWRTGQTLGKRFTYIMAVDRRTGDLLNPAQLLRRYLVPMAALPLLGPTGAFLGLFYGLSYAMGRDQLSLADRIGQSIVVVARYRPERPGHRA